MRNRRKKSFIDSAVQGALVRRIVFHWFIFIVLALLSLAVWRIMYTTGFSKPFSALMKDTFSELTPVIVILLALFPIFVWDTVTFSHRFAGPMYRFRSAVRSLAEGEEFRPIKLRKGDFWEDFAKDFNEMVEQLKSEKKAAADPEPVGAGTGHVDYPA